MRRPAFGRAVETLKRITVVVTKDVEQLPFLL
jgi:hypothetical protein